MFDWETDDFLTDAEPDDDERSWEQRGQECLLQIRLLPSFDADKLLDEALKKLHYKGKTMGERLVAAQRDIKSNDNVWYGHKLRNRLVHESDVKLKQRDVREALLGIRAALKDLGAL